MSQDALHDDGPPTAEGMPTRTLRFRPTFCLVSQGDPKEVIRRIGAIVDEAPNEVTGQFADRHAVISILDSKRHFWSPCLNLDVSPHEAGSQVFCRFSPHPSIWTGFMFAYMALAVLAFFSLIVGVSQNLAGEASFAYYTIPIWCVIALVLWVASQAGQKLAYSEMEMMRKMVEACVE